jgi:ABC-2 type transport system permease protein
MRKAFLVLRYELLTTLRRPSFLFAAFGVPLISALILAGVAAVNREAPSAMQVVTELLVAPAAPSSLPEGYVDESGLVRSLPATLPAGALRRFPDEASARRALQAGEISGFYLVAADYLHSGRIISVRPDFKPFVAGEQGALMEYVLQVNLLAGDEQLAQRLNHPLDLQVQVLVPQGQRDLSNPLAFFIPYGITLAFYFVLLTSASILLGSIAREKENRVLEILLVSVTPYQMLAGKMTGLGVAGMVQAAAWIGSAALLLRRGGQALTQLQAFQLAPHFVFWGLVYFILGYLVYAALLAAVGALAPDLREASQVTFLILLPLLVPLLLITLIIRLPNGSLAVALSLFPLTAPVAMMARLAAGPVPLWQLILAAFFLAITAVLVVRSVARVFHLQALLSGQPFSLRKLARALAGGIPAG